MCCKPADPLFCLLLCAKRWHVKQAENRDNAPPLTLCSTAAPPHSGRGLRSVDPYRRGGFEDETVSVNVDRRLEDPAHKSVCTCTHCFCRECEVLGKKPRSWTMSVRFDLLESADTTAGTQEWSVVNHFCFCFWWLKPKCEFAFYFCFFMPQHQNPNVQH